MDSIVNIDKITGTNCVIDIKTSFLLHFNFWKKTTRKKRSTHKFMKV